MKSMNDNGNNDGNSNHNWLGFSLSPHMKIEATAAASHHHHHDNHHQYHHQSQAVSSAAAVSNVVPATFYLSPSQLGTYYGGGENGGFHSPLTVMPLKSDGSLCIMEALSRSQAQGIIFTFDIYIYIYIFRIILIYKGKKKRKEKKRRLDF